MLIAPRGAVVSISATTSTAAPPEASAGSSPIAVSTAPTALSRSVSARPLSRTTAALAAM